MLWDFMIFLAITIASPILPDSNEYITVDDSSTNNLDIPWTGTRDMPWTNNPDIAMVENAPQGDCTSNAFPDNEDDNLVIHRRSDGFCRPPQVYRYDDIPSGDRTTPSEPAKKNPYEKVRYDSSDDVCIEKEHPIPVTCGGPERLSGNVLHNIAWSPYVANCIPGFQDIVPRRWGFVETEKVARYCCKAYDGAVPDPVGIWYFGVDCWKLRPATMFPRYNDEQWQKFVDRTVRKWKQTPRPDG